MQKIDILRQKIDKLDLEILALLDRRRKTALLIGEIKASRSMEVIDEKREGIALTHRIIKAKKLKIPRRLVCDLFRLIFSDSRQIQKKQSLL